jgi:Tfp pilus assembly PilM family ATPase
VFFQNGRPLYVRRIDVGMVQMTVPEVALAPTGEAGGWHMFDAEEAEGPATPGEPAFQDRLGRADEARQRLVVEIGRSLDYFGRSYVSDLTSLEVVLLPNDLNLAGLPVYATAALEQEVTFADAFEHVRVQAAALPQEEGVAYAPPSASRSAR